MSPKMNIVCYSGGIGSALVAIEVWRKHGTDGLILVNHDINPNVEDADIKRFKQEVAELIGVPITYVNIAGVTNPELLPDQFDVTMAARAFKVGTGTELCTSRLKTEPFMRWLDTNVNPEHAVIYYGFGENEMHRVERRRRIMDSMGYRTEYPLAEWQGSIRKLEEVNIKPPGTYSVFKHANCQGCLKAGKQHWYVVYVHRPDIYEKAERAEEYIGYTIHRGEPLKELRVKFEAMKQAGIEANENIPVGKFWSDARKALKGGLKNDGNVKPCECAA